ncbi:MAG: DUF2087 domain-containing protein [Bacillota bacterium]|nr:MAG: DUF2087 domain-containing protein [Bacillota bacterium]
MTPASGAGVLPPTDFERTLRLLKALADATRLRLLGILSTQERSVEELAALLELRAPTVSHHLGVLRSLGLVTMTREGNIHHYRLNHEVLRAIGRELSRLDEVAARETEGREDAWERKVLSDFLDGLRLKEIPARRKKRQVILEWLASKFTPGAVYREAEVNETLKAHHPDFATLRRELVMSGFLEREEGLYRRPEGTRPR